MNNKDIDVQSMVRGADPLARAVSRTTGQNLWIAALMVGVYVLVTGIIPSEVISCYYDGKTQFISVFQHRESIAAVLWGIVTPVTVFVFWAWQPIGVEALFVRLRETGVVPKWADGEAFRSYLNCNLALPLRHPRTMVAAILTVVAAFLLGSIPNWCGAISNPKWWSINPLYYWAVYSGTLLVAWYVLAWALMRQLVVIRALYVLFRTSAIEPKLMHPDGCMGFAAIGNYALMFCIPIILFAFNWTLGLVFLPISPGNEPTYFSTVICLAVYPIFLSLFLIAPTMSAHSTMKSHRDHALETVAVEIRKWLADSNKTMRLQNMEALKGLQYEYEVIYKNYATWPFRTYMLWRFCVVAGLPLLPNVLSIITQTLKASIPHH